MIYITFGSPRLIYLYVKNNMYSGTCKINHTTFLPADSPTPVAWPLLKKDIE